MLKKRTRRVSIATLGPQKKKQTNKKKEIKDPFRYQIKRSRIHQRTR